MAKLEKTDHTGIYQAHRKSCARKGKCRCPYQAAVYSKADGRLIRKHFPALGPAKTWREDALVALRQKRMRAPARTTVAEAAESLVAGMEDGSVYDRTGRPYKPSTRRSYERALRLHVLPRLGLLRVSGLERRDVQGLVEDLHSAGYSASTIHNTLNPLQVMCRRAVHRGELAVDPTEGLRLPAIRGRRERIEAPEQARVLIEALPAGERALWATAVYAGLRRG